MDEHLKIEYSSKLNALMNEEIISNGDDKNAHKH